MTYENSRSTAIRRLLLANILRFISSIQDLSFFSIVPLKPGLLGSFSRFQRCSAAVEVGLVRIVQIGGIGQTIGAVAERKPRCRRAGEGGGFLRLGRLLECRQPGSLTKS